MSYLPMSWLAVADPVRLLCVSNRCQEVGSEDRRREKREDKCPFLENSGSEEDVLQILQYMATILGNYVKLSRIVCVLLVWLFDIVGLQRYHSCPIMLIFFLTLQYLLQILKIKLRLSTMNNLNSHLVFSVFISSNEEEVISKPCGPY